MLIVSIIIGFVLVAIQLFTKQKCHIKKSSVFLILFFAYFLLNIAINSPSQLVAFTVATTGGVLLFYFLGAMISINLHSLIHFTLKSEYVLKIFNYCYMLFIIVYLYLFVNTFMIHYANKRPDIFLVYGLNGHYQRAGNFLVIAFLIYSIMTALFLFINKQCRYSKFSKFNSFIVFLSYCITIMGGIILSQLFGSNNASVNLVGLFLAMATMYSFISFPNSQQLLTSLGLNFKKIFFSKKLLLSVFFVLALCVVWLIIIISFHGVDAIKFRLTGFDWSGEFSR